MNKTKKMRYLVACRAGDQSLHKEWFASRDLRNFDLLIDYYGNRPGLYALDCEFYFESKGTKFPSLYNLIAEHPALFFGYDAVWFPDDDLRTDCSNINRMFEAFTENQLLLAQPALTQDSYFTYGITLQDDKFHIRYTDFVEVMAPIFSKQALQSCWKTFNKSVSSWGLDLLWIKLLDSAEHKIAIIDSTPVKHTKPVGGGSFMRELKIMPYHELLNIVKEHNLQFPRNFQVFGGIRK